MIWNLEINDPNIIFLLQKERESLNKLVEQQKLFQEAIQQIQDEQIKQLIQENVNLVFDAQKLKTLKQQLQFCVKLQTFFRKGNQYIQNDDFDQIIDFFVQFNTLIETHIELINQDEHIQQFINTNKKQLCDQIIQKYEQQIIIQLKEIGFPDPNDLSVEMNIELIEKLKPYKNLTKQMLIFQPNFLCQTFNKLNQNFDYHFIDISQHTSDVEKPNWLFNYLYDQFEDSIKQLFKLDSNYQQQIQNYSNYELEEIGKIFSHLMIQDYIIVNIVKRLKRDQEDFQTRPNLALSFIEEFHTFCERIEQFWFICFDQKFDSLYEQIILVINEINIFQKVLELEVTLFNQSIFDEYEKKISQNNIHLFLNLVEEFQIVWNSEHYKYSKLVEKTLNDQVDTFFKLIFLNFIELCNQYFSIIESIQEKDYIQFLQTYYIGIKNLKKKFGQFKSSIKKLQQSTLEKMLQPTANRCAEDIFQKLLKNYLFDDKQFSDFFSSVHGSTMYKNQQIYFIQSQHEFSRKINNFFPQANIAINRMVNDNLTQKQYTNHLAAKVVAMTICQLQDRVQKFVIKQEFSQEGAKLFVLTILRTVQLVLYQAINMGNTKKTHKIIEKYQQIETLFQNRYMLNDQSNFTKLVSKDEIEFIKKMKIRQVD